MLIANVLQRGIGFGRNVGFCSFLSEEQLGLWALASSFFVLGAPLAVLGLPGTFGRFVETYRVRGQLPSFLIRIFLVSLIGTGVMSIALLVMHQALGHLILGVDTTLQTMALIVATLGAVILFNVSTELANGLRQSKIASMMHSSSSLIFTLISIVVLLVWPDWRSIVLAFGLSSLLALWPLWRLKPVIAESRSNEVAKLKPSEMWRRILPFAASVWTMNLLINLFEVVDRYTLLYLSATPEQGAALVGQFHSAKILPVLLTSLTSLVSAMLLPYLAKDWEAGETKQVRTSLEFSVKTAIFAFFVISIGAMVFAPWLFQYVLKNKYQEGLDAMPLALIYCCFSASSVLLQNYFWCAEKGRVVGLITALGLVANLLLNLWWVPYFGLNGAMAATAISGLAILLLTLISLRLVQIRFSWSFYLITALPLLLLMGPIAAMAGAAVVVILTSRTSAIFDAAEKRILDHSLLPVLTKIGMTIPSIWHFRDHR
ncbi:MAG: oligosaccharide flippase family protein [Pirellula sp.]|jgi:O-antigen/teichoic acid export membrane protein|nr:oligosaccharide flippase family protein [Pirellula sp.]